MRWAFHFNDSGAGWREYDEILFRAILGIPLRLRNVVVQRGNVLDWDFGKNWDQVADVVTRIFEDTYATITANEYLELLRKSRFYVLLVEGLTSHSAKCIINDVKLHSSYLATLALNFERPLHWAVFDTGLPTAYRVVGDELRLRHGTDDVIAEDNRDHGSFGFWRSSGLFASVAWENVGLRSTIFDVFDTPQHAKIVGETERYVGNLLEGVGTQVVLRAQDLDPHLIEALHAALQALETARTSEQLAQAALSSRRFLERLADRLFPPTDEVRNGRELSADKWKNRLWAYVEDSLGRKAAAAVDLSLADIGNRIDAIVAAAQAGVHKQVVQHIAVTRLIVGLVSLVYDLVLLSPPPYELPEDAYEGPALEIIRDAFDS